MLQDCGNAPVLLEDSSRCLIAAAEAATHLLKPSIMLEPSNAVVTGAGPHCSATAVQEPSAATVASNLAGSAVAAGSSSSAKPAALQLLPSLVICGRYFLMYGLQLATKFPVMIQVQQMNTQQHEPAGPEGRPFKQLVYTPEAPRHGVVDVLFREAPGVDDGMESRFELILQTCLDWLTSSSVSAQLAEAGYGSSSEGAVAVAVRQMRLLVAAHKVVRDSGPVQPAACHALAKQLQAAGKVLSSLAVSGCCNNPACVNISRTLEASLVSGHTTKCSSCRTAPLLQQGLPGCALEAAQASVQGTSCCACCQGWWCSRMSPQLEGSMAADCTASSVASMVSERSEASKAGLQACLGLHD